MTTISIEIEDSLLEMAGIENLKAFLQEKISIFKQQILENDNLNQSQKEMEKVWNEKGYNDNTINEWLNEQS